MNTLPGILIATVMTITSQASMSQTGNEHYGKHIPIVTQPKTATPSVQARANIPRIPKFKVLRSNPHRYSKIIIDDLDYEIDDDGLITPYRRRDLNKIEHTDGLSDRVKWRLFLARQMALLKYKEKWA